MWNLGVVGRGSGVIESGVCRFRVYGVFSDIFDGVIGNFRDLDFIGFGSISICKFRDLLFGFCRLGGGCGCVYKFGLLEV